VPATSLLPPINRVSLPWIPRGSLRGEEWSSVQNPAGADWRNEASEAKCPF